MPYLLVRHKVDDY
jgi:heme-degrading monooxygenase HmoA